MTWHPTADVLSRYSDNEIDSPNAFSVEAHLLACGLCREAIAKSVDPEWVEVTWNQIEISLSASKPSVVERVLTKFGIADHTARLLAATPTLRRSWLLAVTCVVAFAAGAARASEYGYALFLLLAPVLPLAGVAGAYGPEIDPSYEIGLVSPMRSSKLLLIRSAAVLIATLAIVTAGAVLLPNLDWRSVAWLLPAIGLVLSSLALSTVISPLRAALAAAVTWLLVAVTWLHGSLEAGSVRDAFGLSMQTTFLVVSLVGGAVLYARRGVWEGARKL